MSHKLAQVSLLIATCIVAAKGWALEGERNWGLSTYLGLFNPSLQQLNKGEFHSPYEGNATLVDQFGNNNWGESDTDTRDYDLLVPINYNGIGSVNLNIFFKTQIKKGTWFNSFF